MQTYRTAYSDHRYVSQSRVLHSRTKMHGLNRWSMQLARWKHTYNPKREKHGLTLWIALGPVRLEVGRR